MVTFPSFLSYIDPNTTHHVFTLLAPLMSVLCFIMGMLVWPFRFALSRAWRRFRGLPRRQQVVLVSAFVAVLAVVAGILYAVLAGEGGAAMARKAEPGPFSRVIVLGMDGLEPEIVEGMMAAGELPHFKKLSEAGGYSRLRTSAPPESPVAWSTIATGCGPGEHGILDFLHRDPKTYIPYLSIRRSKTGVTGTKYLKARRRDGFWAYTSAAGIPSTVIRWPVAFPAEEVNGRFLSGLGVPDLLGGEGRYYHFTSVPVSDDDPSPHNVVQVRWDGTSAETEIPGPATGGDSRAAVSLAISRSGEDRVTVAVESVDPVEAVVGEWSPWLPLRFPVGFGKVHGQIKFMLTEVEPHLRLTSSPIHMDPRKQAFAFTYPKSFGAELFGKLGPFHTLGLCEQAHPVSHGRYGLDAFLAECRTIDAERRKMLDIELGRFKEGLLAFVFDTSDRLQHMFWFTRDAEHPGRDPGLAAKYADVIPQMYREMDAVLGRVLAKVDDRTALIALSDHGFTTFRRAAHVNRWLIENGYMNLSCGNETEGRGLFQDIDWSRTRAYAMGFAGIYVNLKGREGEGIVKTGSDHAALLEEIQKKLQEWTDPTTGASVVAGVCLTSRTNPGPAAADGPDLVVGMNDGYRFSWQTAVGGAPTALLEDNTKPWSGGHLVDSRLVPGVLFCNQKIKRADPSLEDIAPTVLNCSGIEPPEHMTGQPLF